MQNTKAGKPAPPVPPAELQEGPIAAMDSAGLIRVIQNASASEFQRAKACQRAGELGAVEAVAAMGALLGDEKLNSYARSGLENIASPAADEALRTAAGKLKGDQQIGVVNSIGKRRDAKAIPMLAKYLVGSDLALAAAAAAALGSIGTTESARVLQPTLGKTSGRMKMAVADACLVCAERFLSAGQRDAALKLYAFVAAADSPKPARLGAMSAIVREETSLSRPR